jgi:hypothetical protein
MMVMDGGKRISGDSNVWEHVLAFFKEVLAAITRVSTKS